MPSESVWDYIENGLIWGLEMIAEAVEKTIRNNLPIVCGLIILLLWLVSQGCEPKVALDFVLVYWKAIKLSGMTVVTFVWNLIISHIFDSILNIL